MHYINFVYLIRVCNMEIIMYTKKHIIDHKLRYIIKQCFGPDVVSSDVHYILSCSSQSLIIDFNNSEVQIRIFHYADGWYTFVYPLSKFNFSKYINYFINLPIYNTLENLIYNNYKYLFVKPNSSEVALCLDYKSKKLCKHTMIPMSHFSAEGAFLFNPILELHEYSQQDNKRLKYEIKTLVSQAITSIYNNQTQYIYIYGFNHLT